MIKVEDLHKRFGDEEILKGISTSFDKGKTNLILGQSGSGKTVMLKCLIGLFTPEEGKIYYDDKAIQEMNDDQQRDLREEMGMLFQGGALFDSMNIEQNVMFPLRMFTKQKKSEMLDRVNDVLKRVNLENVNKKFPSEISGGMQKRVSIARAIVNRPKYLFCDEPNSGLDPKTATLIDNLVQELTHEYDITTVVVTHDMNSVMEIGEKIVLLKNGKLVWEGTNEEIFKTDNQDVIDFVYSSDLFKKIREVQLKEVEDNS
jgi:phospholipid/cholesterol/gamma-HCH transport system ATP-binding protein